MNTDIDFTITGHGSSDPEVLFFIPNNIRLFTGQFGIDIQEKTLHLDNIYDYISKNDWKNANFPFVVREYKPGSICPDNLINFQGFHHELIGGLLPVKEMEEIFSELKRGHPEISEWDLRKQDTRQQFIEISGHFLRKFNELYPITHRALWNSNAMEFSDGYIPQPTPPTDELITESMTTPRLRRPIFVRHHGSDGMELVHKFTDTTFYFNIYPIDREEKTITAGPYIATTNKRPLESNESEIECRLSKILKWLSEDLKSKHGDEHIFNVLLISCRGQNKTRKPRDILNRPGGGVRVLHDVSAFTFHDDILDKYSKCKVDFGDNIFDGTFLRDLNDFELLARVDPARKRTPREGVMGEALRAQLETGALDTGQAYQLRKLKSYSGIEININDLQEKLNIYAQELKGYSINVENYRIHYKISDENGEPLKIFKDGEEELDLETFVENIEVISSRYNREEFKDDFNKNFKIYLNIKSIIDNSILFPIYQFCEILYFFKNHRQILRDIDKLFKTGLFIRKEGPMSYLPQDMDLTDRMDDEYTIENLKAVIEDKVGIRPNENKLYQVKGDGSKLLMSDDSQIVEDLDKDTDDKIVFEIVDDTDEGSPIPTEGSSPIPTEGSSPIPTEGSSPSVGGGKRKKSKRKKSKRKKSKRKKSKRKKSKRRKNTRRK